MHVRPELRGRGYAAEALRLWEEKMAEAGFDTALCSIPTDDAAQHFYRKMGYRETGALSIPFGAFAQPMEILFIKRLGAEPADD